MGLEIERRFLVEGEQWRDFAGPPQFLRQGYLASSTTGFTIRIRILPNNKAWLTIKAPLNEITRHEFEYLIPEDEAEQLWNLTEYRVTKNRYKLSIADEDWIVDCFEEKNKSLVLAEVELDSAHQEIEIPQWCWHEITGDSQWSNAALAQMPIANWSIEKRKVFKCA